MGDAGTGRDVEEDGTDSLNPGVDFPSYTHHR